jgi:hypothetical protein
VDIRRFEDEMTESDPKLEALDLVDAALRKIYAAKRAGKATAQDETRLKQLHTEWMSVMRKIVDGAETIRAR